MNISNYNHHRIYGQTIIAYMVKYNFRTWLLKSVTRIKTIAGRKELALKTDNNI
jgi:hypothetical protein